MKPGFCQLDGCYITRVLELLHAIHQCWATLHDFTFQLLDYFLMYSDTGGVKKKPIWVIL